MRRLVGEKIENPLGLEVTVARTPPTMEVDRAIHVLRNPWGHPDEDIRQARDMGASALEKLQKAHEEGKL